MQSNLLDWTVIDNPKSKLDLGFGLSIQFFHFNPNPKSSNYFLTSQETKISWCIKLKKSQANLNYNFHKKCLSVKLCVDKEISLGTDIFYVEK
jgi:hypothetical protein